MIRIKEKLVDLEKYGFLVDIEELKDYSNSSKILLNESVAKALVAARKDLPKSYNLKIKDGARSLAVQRKIVEIHEKQFKRDHPDNWLELLNKYTGGYSELKIKKISFLNHRSGYAVDLTITKNNRELNMGGVSLNERDNLYFYKNKEELSKEEEDIKKNRRLLEKIMTKAGFKPHPPEWWHWGYKQK